MAKHIRLETIQERFGVLFMFAFECANGICLTISQLISSFAGKIDCFAVDTCACPSNMNETLSSLSTSVVSLDTLGLPLSGGYKRANWFSNGCLPCRHDWG